MLAMITGIMDFMIRSERTVEIPAIAVPDLAVPYAAPSAEKNT